MTQELQEYLTLISQRPLEYAQGGLMEIVVDPVLLEAYSKEHQTKLGIVYQSSRHIYVVDLVRDKAGNLFPYERLLKTVTGSSVVVVPFYEDKVVLLEQFRHALGEFQYCFPRGFAEAGISPMDNARKELQEELKCHSGTPELLGQVVADSGICGEKVWVFRCSITQPHTDGIYENIQSCITVPLSELQEMVRKGEINDGFTLSAITLLQNTPLCKRCTDETPRY